MGLEVLARWLEEARWLALAFLVAKPILIVPK